MKNYLTETEKMTLKHVFGFDNYTIEHFNDLNLDDKTRNFIIFNMLAKLQEKEKSKIPVIVQKESIFRRIFKNRYRKGI